MLDSSFLQQMVQVSVVSDRSKQLVRQSNGMILFNFSFFLFLERHAYHVLDVDLELVLDHSLLLQRLVAQVEESSLMLLC